MEKKHLHFLEMPPCWITSSNIWQFGQFGLLAPVQQRGVEGGLAAWFCQFFLTCLSGSLSFPLLFSFICPHLLRWSVYCSPGVPWGVGRGAWVVLTGALLSLRVCLPSLGFCAVLGHSLWMSLLCLQDWDVLVDTRSCVGFWHWCRLSCMFLTQHTSALGFLVFAIGCH